MTRSLSVAMQAAIASSNVRPIYLVEIEFVGTTLNLCSATKDYAWNAITWSGNAQLQSIEGIEEQMDTRSSSWRIGLSGADSSLVSLALGSSNQSKTATVYLGLLDSSEAIIVDPEQVAYGHFAFAEISDNGKDSFIALNYESDLFNLKRVQSFRYTHQSQQALFAGDDGFEYTAAAENWSGFWGKTSKVPRPRRKRR